jgi:hypothetical protein
MSILGIVDIAENCLRLAVHSWLHWSSAKMRLTELERLDAFWFDKHTQGEKSLLSWSHLDREFYEWIYFSRSKLALRVEYEFESGGMFLWSTSRPSNIFHNMLSDFSSYGSCLCFVGISDIDEFQPFSSCGRNSVRDHCRR